MREIEGENVLFFDGERVPEEFIRYIRVRQLEVKEIEGEEVLFIDGERVPEELIEIVEKRFSNNRNIQISLKEEAIEYLKGIKFDDIERFWEVRFEYQHNFPHEFDGLKTVRIFIDESRIISLNIKIDGEEWESFLGVKRKLDVLFEKLRSRFKSNWVVYKQYSLGNYIRISGMQLPENGFYEEVSYMLDKLFAAQQEILDEGLLDERLSISQEFEFPKEIRVYCEQYLIYFAQFLKDVGVEATASITENDGKSIFRVKPKNRDEALEKIQEALAIYLNLPTVVTLDQFPSLDSSMEVKILHSQIHDLQNKLSLTIEKIRQQNLSLEMQNSVIGEKNRIIEQQNSLIQSMQSGRVLIESMRDEDQDCEEIIDGVASIKKYQLGPLEFDLPNIFRKMKEMFRDSRDD